MDNLFGQQQSEPIPFSGSDFDEKRDRARLTTQLGCILAVVGDGQWRTITRLAIELRRAYPAVSFPENSIQAQLRNLRKLGYTVDKHNAASTGVLYEYRVQPPINPGVGNALLSASGVAA